MAHIPTFWSDNSPSQSQPAQPPSIPVELTAEQEQDLLLVPESLHAGISTLMRYYNMGTPLDQLQVDLDNVPITSVPQAAEFLIKATQQAQQLGMSDIERKSAERKNSSHTKSERSRIWWEYVQACQVRKNRIDELQAQIQLIRSNKAQLTPAQQQYQLWLVAQEAVFEQQVKDMRAKFEAWIAAQPKPEGQSTDLVALTAELKHLRANLVPRPALPPL